MPPRDWRLRIEDILEAAGRIETGMRNVLIHAYFGIDLGIVWQTATVDVPALAAKLRA